MEILFGNTQDMNLEYDIIKPIFLLADSQLLFYKNEEGLFLGRIKKLLNKDLNVDEIKAAYIGASNNDDPLFYDIFKQAIQQIDIRNSRMIGSSPNEEDTLFLKSADIILLAGGDTEKGWEIIKQNGWNDIIIEKYSKGVILIGVSAGAIQLGTKGNLSNPGFNMLQLVPHIIDAHADDDWLDLTRQVEIEGGKLKGYGIPFGAGIIYYPDMSLEVVRFSCTEIISSGTEIIKSIILPPEKQN